MHTRAHTHTCTALRPLSRFIALSPRMPSIMFMRGYWWHGYVRALAPTCVFERIAPLLRRITPYSSMSCMLRFSQPCAAVTSGASCVYCVKSRQKRTSKSPAYHTISLIVRHESGVGILIDETPDVPEKWTTLRLVGVSDEQCRALWARVHDAGFNHAGHDFNFLPRWMRPCCAAGVGARRDDAPPLARPVYFCSELLCEFLQHTCNFDLQLEPCETTPQMLHHALLARTPQSVRVESTSSRSIV